MNLKQKLLNWAFREEYDQIRNVMREVTADWQMVPYTMRQQESLTRMLSEMDPQLYDMLLRNLRDYQVVSGQGASENYRQSLVKQSRSMYLTDPVYAFGVKTWTDFGFSQSPTLTAEDPAAQETWDEFWNANRNAPVLGQRKLHKLSDNQIVDGELFFALFASTVDGLSTVRTIDSLEIKEIITDPEDKNIPLYYRRDYTGVDAGLTTLYYPDWAATDDQLARAKLPTDARRADQAAQQIGGMPATDVRMLHVAFREIGGRGWPLASTGMDWEQVYSGFLKDRAAVAKASASVVEKIKAKGGQRAIDLIRSRIGSSIPGSSDQYEQNPPPTAGSIWIENEALSREWMNRPTGASDAEKDGQPLLAQVGLSFGLFSHWLGRGEAYRLATATSMELPVLRGFNRYQNFWSSVWQDMLRIVCSFAEEYGNKNFSSTKAQASTDTVINVAADDIALAITSLTEMVDRGIIEIATAQQLGLMLERTALEAMGIRNANEFTNDKAKEAGTDQIPFDRLQESGASNYGTAVRGAVYALWSGKLDKTGFLEQLEDTVDRGLRRAWAEGFKAIGIKPSEMTSEEDLMIGKIILNQFDYTDGFADWILANNKASKGKLADLQYRVSTWVNRYTEVYNQAMLRGREDPKLKWVYNPAMLHRARCTQARNTGITVAGKLMREVRTGSVLPEK